MEKLMINWRTETKQLKDLKPWTKNPRKISKDAYVKLKERITERGFHDIIKIDTHNIVLSGNQRIKALKELGYKEVSVKTPDRELTEEEIEKVALESNLNDGEWDNDLLVADFDMDLLEDVGFDSADLDISGEDEDLEKKINEVYQIIIECEDEKKQLQIYNFLEENEIDCKIVSL